MSIDTTPDSGATEDLAELERKVADLHAARAQMVAEREEHVRDAARAATVLGGLAQIHRELGARVTERAAARDAADTESDTATAEFTRLTQASANVEASIADLEARLAIARETTARLVNERVDAERIAAEAASRRELARANYDETARAAADVARKYEAAVAEATIAEGRDVQFTDIEETLDREQSLAETRLRDARARAETLQVESDLRRIREQEDLLARERADLERRLRAMRSSVVATPPAPQPQQTQQPQQPQPPQSVAQGVMARTPIVDPPSAAPPLEGTRRSVASANAVEAALPARDVEPQRLSLAARLLRDLAKPSTGA